MADCDSYNAGATCSLSCLNNYKLDGDDIVVCEDDSRTEKIDYLWNDMNNTACIGTIKYLYYVGILYGNSSSINKKKYEPTKSSFEFSYKNIN